MNSSIQKFGVAILLLVLGISTSHAQNIGINEDGSLPSPSAILDLKSINKGFLAPRMTQTQRDNISSPAEGLLIYQLDGARGYYLYNGSNWLPISGAWNVIGNDQYSALSGNVGIGTSTPANKLQVAGGNIGWGTRYPCCRRSI